MANKILDYETNPVANEDAVARDADNNFYTWRDGAWIKVDNLDDMKINLGMTEYDLQKQIVEQLPSKITEAQLAPIYQLIAKYQMQSGNDYYMLLCNDIHYYTVFDTSWDNVEEPFNHEVIECLQNVGVIQCAELREDGTAVEIWVKNDKGCFMFLLFEYDWGIVKCR